MISREEQTQEGSSIIHLKEQASAYQTWSPYMEGKIHSAGEVEVMEITYKGT
jgi:hypothetical protein